MAGVVRFRRLRDDSWGVQVDPRGVAAAELPTTGDEVVVLKAGGGERTVVLGESVAKFPDAHIFKIADGKPAARAAVAAPKFPPTAEQETALTIFRGGDDLAIEAGAGTGKTSSLVYLAFDADGRGLRGQYIAFNTAIVGDSAGKFPASVECNTAHSLAVRAIGREFFPRQNASTRMKSTDIAKILKLDSITVTKADGEKKTLTPGFLAGHVQNAVKRFCQSADAEPTYRHFPRVDGLDAPPSPDRPTSYGVNDEVARQLVPALQRAWKDLSMYQGQLPFTLSTMMMVVLKLWQLSTPKINADYILFDEAQDASPVMVDVIRQQTHAQVVWVGDSNQQIYSFTGAINALSGVPAKNRAMLTQSFRFGPAVADHANVVLATLPTEMKLVGTPTIPSVVGEIDEPDAILTRTNATALRAVMTALAEGRKPFLVGGGTEIARFCRAAADLQRGQRVDHPELACFESWSEVQEYVADDAQGNELRLMVKLIDDFGVDEILAAVNGCADEKDADLVVSTAHKSKGREWNSVRLGGDFPEGAKMGEEERRLLYVAVTRAKLALDVSAVEFFNPAADSAAGDEGVTA